jgi:hypothetical protein
LLEQIESNVAQDGEILGAMVLADSTTIFIESDIQTPMELVFNAPVRTYS